jgi:primosomal protein N' (replication factor Y)
MHGTRMAADPHAPPLVEVAVPVGVDRTFVYRVPPELASMVRPGSRVEVPFRRRLLQGVVVGIASRSPAGGTLRAIRAALDPKPVLGEEMLAFTRWLAGYYAAPWGEVLRTALPAVLAPRRRRRRSAGGEAEIPAGGHAAAALAPTPAPTLTEEQVRAVAHLERRLGEGTFRVVLLHGVTASGKTEVYLRAAEAVVRLGGQVLVLVPEIGLSVQLVDRFAGRLGTRVAVLHSGLTDADRRGQWERVLAGEVPVVVGARSALFAPLTRLKLIVIDEEHEAAYKQDEVPRYHARDAAVMRGQMNKAVVLLGSATPSLESAYNAASGRYDLVRLEHRVDSKPLPTVVVADLRRGEGGGGGATVVVADLRRGEGGGGATVGGATTGEDGAAASGEPIPAAAETTPAKRRAPVTPPTVSPLLRDALSQVLERQEQAILLVHRRGHSTFVQCTDCGAVARCPACEVALTYHAVGFLLRCHHCNRRRRAPDHCPDCDGTRFWYGGVGTQRVQNELKRDFPEARLLRMDLDSTRRRGAHREMIDAFARRQADILLGTQMVAKGLDFPEVRLVGVVSADTLFNLPDFRAGERSFQLLSQVAGRAGRGPIEGQVIIQTYMPDHPSVVAAAAHDYETFYAAAIVERQELGYPPCGAMARFHVDGPDESPVLEVADRVAAAVGQAADLTLLGPAPLPLKRLRGRDRWHVTLLGRRRSRVHAEARRAQRQVLSAGLPNRVRLQLDLDPIHLL